MQTDITLKNLMDLSPIIDIRINELLSSAVQDEFDQRDTPNQLISEALRLLLELLEEHGIIFYVSIEDLLADRYSIDFIITLYRQFIPQHFEQYLNDNPEMCRTIGATVNNISPDEFIVHILEVVRDIDRNMYSKEMYSFLHDKVKSDERYSNRISDVLQRVYNNKIANKDYLSNISTKEMGFLVKLIEERKWYQTRVNDLIYKEALPIDYQQSTWLISQFRSAYTQPEYLSILSDYEVLSMSNKEVVDGIFAKIRKGSNFYVDNYTDEQLADISLEMVVSIILTQLSDEYLFGIKPDFTRLTTKVTKFDIVSIIKMIPNRQQINH